MAARALVFCGLLACASAAVVQRLGAATRFVCGQQTTISMSTSADAAGTSQFSEVSMSDGVCKTVAHDGVSAIKFCGPGTLTVSRMTCDKHHEYKATVIEHSPKEYTTNCETISMAGTVVEGWLGSMTLKC